MAQTVDGCSVMPSRPRRPTDGIKCLACGRVSGHRVYDSRARSGYIIRRRVCGCGARFNTYELSGTVIKSIKDGGESGLDVIDNLRPGFYALPKNRKEDNS